MIIQLNLISPLQKKELNLLRIYFIIKTFILGLLFITLMISIVLLVVRLTLHINFVNVIEQTTKVVKVNNEISRKVKFVNNIILEANQVTNEFNIWSKVLMPLGGYITTNSKISDLMIEQADGKITISGSSKSPEDFLELKKSLQNNENLTNIIYPENILFESADFNWIITAEINTEKL